MRERDWEGNLEVVTDSTNPPVLMTFDFDKDKFLELNRVMGGKRISRVRLVGGVAWMEHIGAETNISPVYKIHLSRNNYSVCFSDITNGRYWVQGNWDDKEKCLNLYTDTVLLNSYYGRSYAIPNFSNLVEESKKLLVHEMAHANQSRLLALKDPRERIKYLTFSLMAEGFISMGLYLGKGDANLMVASCMAYLGLFLGTKHLVNMLEPHNLNLHYSKYSPREKDANEKEEDPKLLNMAKDVIEVKSLLPDNSALFFARSCS